jgi:hypothetical protein
MVAAIVNIVFGNRNLCVIAFISTTAKSAAMQTNIETIIIILDFILFNQRPKGRALPTFSNQTKHCMLGKIIWRSFYRVENRILTNYNKKILMYCNSIFIMVLVEVFRIMINDLFIYWCHL